MKLGLFGGTFDPIHLGHLRAAENAREALGLDRVAFVPAAVPPHRAEPTASALDRYAMVALATAGTIPASCPPTSSSAARGRATPSTPWPPCCDESPGADLASSWAATPVRDLPPGRSPRGSSRCARWRWWAGPARRRGRRGGAGPAPGSSVWKAPGLPISASAHPGARARGPERPVPRARRGGRLHRRSGVSTDEGPGRGRPRRPRRPRQEGHGRGGPRPAQAAAFTDFFVLASGREPEADRRHRGRGAGDAARACGLRPTHVEGYPRQEWILLDYSGPSWSTSSPSACAPSTTSSGSGAGPRGWRSPDEHVAARDGAPTVVAVSRGHAGAAARWRRRLAEVTSPVLVEGESGTGKDLLAHWLHYNGPRRDGPFIKVHCPSIPEELLESELFGHEHGAFTDARQAKAGKIEMAAGGTLFFDQVEDLSLALQAKLLRVVEERRFERLGGTRTLEVDVRFVSASGLDLRRAVAPGTFREDLYHRLSVVPADPAAPARAARGHPAPGRGSSWPASGSAARAARARSSPRPPTPCAATTGRATCASCAAWWSAPRPGAARSRRCPPAALPPHVLEQPSDAVGRRGTAGRRCGTSSRRTSATCCEQARAARRGPRPSWASAARPSGRSAGVTAFPDRARRYGETKDQEQRR